MGGINKKSNIIYLTPEEHYEVHKLLIIDYPESKSLKMAWNRMKGSGKTPQEYATFRKQHSVKVKNMQTGDNNSFYGKTHTIQTRLKISENQKGTSKSNEFKELVRQRQLGKNNSFYGRKHTKNSLLKISEATKELWKKNHDRYHEERIALHLKWWNNGTYEVKTKECPPGWRKGRSIAIRNIISTTHRKERKDNA